MSSSSDFSDSGRITGQRVPARAPEKSTFSQTCSLLSQYIKEKGTFGDLSLGMTCSLEGNGRFSSSSSSLVLAFCFCTLPKVVSFFLLTFSFRLWVFRHFVFFFWPLNGGNREFDEWMKFLKTVQIWNFNLIILVKFFEI